ncbi:hypothetical protein [Rathayibacter sp. AY1C9]|uniref:hypothetical protein n=1 Tax=Rathayibacter sp. AY1C9 TaxID=2080541 RepID=UPI0011AFE58D|nr:hypothetical protein [Rathayibacter sp. AY1C9]
MVDVLKDGLEHSARGEVTLVLDEGQAFELGRGAVPAHSVTYEHFDEEFERVHDAVPSTLLLLFSREKHVRVMIDLGSHSTGEFQARLDDRELTPDRRSTGHANVAVPRATPNGFVLVLTSKTLRRSIRIRASFGPVTSRPTKTVGVPELDVLRKYLVPELRKRGNSGHLMSLALREYEEGERRGESLAEITHSLSRLLEEDPSVSGVEDGVRYLFRKVCIWCVGATPPKRGIPDRSDWARALRFAKVDAIALNPGDDQEDPRQVEYRTRSHVSDLVGLAAALSSSGALTAEDLQHLLKPQD